MSTSKNRVFSWKLLPFVLLASFPVAATDFAEIPDFSANSSILMISSARTFRADSNNEFNDLDLGESNAQLALVDNVESPSCVAFLQLADTVDAATQQIIAETININCND